MPIVAVIIVILIIGLGIYLYSSSHQGAGTAATSTPPVVTPLPTAPAASSTVAVKGSLMETLGNLSYGLHDPLTKLADGYFTGKFENCGGVSCNGKTYYSHMKLENNIAEGDLNGDGASDAAVVVSSVTTESVSNDNLKYTTQVVAAVVKQGDTYKNVAAIELSHDLNARSVAVKNIQVKRGLIYATVLKNADSIDPRYPSSTETVELKLDASYASGFKIFKDGASEPDSYVEPHITNVTVSGSGKNMVMTITGSNFSLLKNTVMLNLQTSSGPKDYRSLQTESDQNNSRMTVAMSTAGFPDASPLSLMTASDVKTLPSGEYDVTVDAYRCVAGKACKDVVSSPFPITIH
jgi:hypothetical protein